MRFPVAFTYKYNLWDFQELSALKYKVLYAIFFSGEGVAIQVPVKKDKSINEKYYKDVVLKTLKKYYRKRAQSWVSYMSNLHDNATAHIFHFYTPDIRSMWGYIAFAFPFVRLFVRTFVCLFVRSYIRSFVFPSQGQSFCVKVYKTSYFEDPLMDFIHIWHDGRYRSKVFISTIPTPGMTLRSRSRT